MQARNERLNNILKYINGSSYNPSTFSETYKADEFNEEEKSSIASTLFNKAKKLRDIASKNTAFIVLTDAEARADLHWYDLFSSKKKNIHDFEVVTSNYVNKQFEAMCKTLQLAIDYGSEEARIFKLEHNIKNDSGPVITFKK